MEAPEQQLWDECSQGVASARERLVRRYMPLAKRIAASLYARRAVDDVEFGDYLHLAYVGLLESVQRYRSGADAQFATFATYRIRGAILNSIPKMTETGERISHLKKLHRERLASVLDRPEPPAEESFPALVDLVVSVSLTVQIEQIAETLSAEPTPLNDPYASRAYDDMQRRVREVLTTLPERERLIVGDHYFEQVGFDEIARMLGVSKGRVSQLHKRALDQIRVALQERRLAELG
jgi:RNA polymerase sigma factor for flagellar operon FliA